MSLKLGLRNRIRRSRAGGFTGLLDQSFASGATAAYSLRRLKASATKAVRVREDSGNTETDIGFSGGALDTTALLNHVGSNNGFVTKWYDQSGNANDASNSTASQQPQIVSSGSVIQENGRPALEFDGSDDELNLANSIDISQNGFTSFTVHVIQNSADTGFIIGNQNQAQYSVLRFSDDIFIRDDVGFIQKENNPSTGQLLHSGRADNTQAGKQIFENGKQVTNFTDTNVNDNQNFSDLGVFAGNYSKAKAQELILYNFNKINERGKIETNINNHYSIF